MAEVVLFHHAHGLTSGVQALAEELRRAGHVVHVPDLYPAQMLTQTRPGARGALLVHACVPTSEFGGPWPEGVPVQVHGMDADPSCG